MSEKAFDETRLTHHVDSLYKDYHRHTGSHLSPDRVYLKDVVGKDSTPQRPLLTVKETPGIELSPDEDLLFGDDTGQISMAIPGQGLPAAGGATGSTRKKKEIVTLGDRPLGGKQNFDFLSYVASRHADLPDLAAAARLHAQGVEYKHHREHPGHRRGFLSR